MAESVATLAQVRRHCSRASHFGKGICGPNRSHLFQSFDTCTAVSSRILLSLTSSELAVYQRSRNMLVLLAAAVRRGRKPLGSVDT